MLLVTVMYAADHPRLHSRSRQQIITLDAAISDEREVRDRLESLLSADVQRLVVTETDLVRDVTVADVRYRVHDSPAAEEQADTPRALPSVASVRQRMGLVARQALPQHTAAQHAVTTAAQPVPAAETER